MNIISIINYTFKRNRNFHNIKISLKISIIKQIQYLCVFWKLFKLTFGYKDVQNIYKKKKISIN